MIQVNISTLKNQLSSILRKVKKGQEVLVMDRDRPIARLSAVRESDIAGNDEQLLNELERKGIVRRAEKPLPSAEWFRKHAIRLPEGVDIVQALLDERKENRF